MLIAQVLRNSCYSSQALNSWFRPQVCRHASSAAASQSRLVTPGEDFYKKNERLNRPMSPHLTIYRIQLTSSLSITHRMTGLAMSVAMSGFAIAAMTLPGMYPMYLASLKSLAFGPAIIGTAKFALAWPFMYHLCAGLRHLAWDTGRGFTLQTVYRTGYAVIAVSMLLSLGAALL